MNSLKGPFSFSKPKLILPGREFSFSNPKSILPDSIS